MPSAALESGSACHLLLDVWLSGLEDSQVSETFLWHLGREDMYPLCAQVYCMPAGTRTCPGEVLVSEPWVGVPRTPRHTRKGKISHRAFFSPETKHFSHGWKSLSCLQHSFKWLNTVTKEIGVWAENWAQVLYLSSSALPFLPPLRLCRKTQRKIWKPWLNYFCCLMQQSDLFNVRRKIDTMIWGQSVYS